MTRLLPLLALLVISACGTSYAPQAIANVATASPKPEKQATATPVPSPTIGYQETAIFAMQTANKADQANVEVTLVYLQAVLQQAEMTADAEKNNMQILSWTATAALTSVPATASQQAIVNTQVVAANTLAVAKITATADYPSLVKRAEDTKNYIKYGGAYNVFGLIGLFVAIILMVAGIVAIVKFWVMNPAPVEDEEEEQEKHPVTRINLYTNNGARSELHGVPCTPEQLTEFADKTVNKGVTIGINNWEGEDTLWTRDYYKPFREWLESVGLAVSFKKPNGAIQYAPVEPNLSDFLRGWLTTNQLPNGYEFQEQTKQAEPDYGGELVPVTR